VSVVVVPYGRYSVFTSESVRQPEPAGADLRDIVFASVRDCRFAAQICARSAGVLSGSSLLRDKAEEIGVAFLRLLPEGAPLVQGSALAQFAGTAAQIALCEDNLIGLVSKYSGVATAAAHMHQAAGRLRVVCGAWKKMPVDSKQALRQAITTGGLPTRLVDESFVYLDKNYVRMLGGIQRALAAARTAGRQVRIIQIRGETCAIADEAVVAAEAGANVVMVDTGALEDVRGVSESLRSMHVREAVRIAFAGGLGVEDLGRLQTEDIDIVDIGRAVIDAPLLDMSMDVTGRRDAPPSREDGDSGWR
jgi:nicotinate-nucleotide pyrophosphorylase (carboxylating)